jgi:Tfp pilus assembly protein PilP
MTRVSRLLFSTLLLAAMPLLAQGGTPQQPPRQPEVAPQPPSPESTAKIDEILQGDEAVLQGVTSTYDPGNRRDPFQSLLAAEPRQIRGPRPPGVAGLLIDEIDVTGIFETSKGFVAQIQAQNQKKSYLLREGQAVYDGDVLRIEKNQVVFRQIVNDPTVIKPFREVVKKLLP